MPQQSAIFLQSYRNAIDISGMVFGHLPSSELPYDQAFIVQGVLKILLGIYPQEEIPCVTNEANQSSWIDWMKNVYAQDRKGNRSGAVALFIEKVDELLWAGKFEDVDSIVESLKPDALSTPLILGVLCITKPALNNLKRRTNFFDMAWETVKKRGKDPEKLLEFFRNIPVENESRA